MRSEIEKIIYSGEMMGDKDDQAFRSYADREVIGSKIADGLISKMVVDEQGVKHFILDDVESRTGFLSDVYGCAGIFSLINRMEVDLSEEQKSELVKTIRWIFQYIRENGYTLDPFYNDKAGAKRLFDKGHPFIGAMTWSLSLFVSVRRAVQNGELELDDESNEFIIKQIINIVNAFNDYAILEKTESGEGGKCQGWSFSSGCLQPSLFYTYSVLEAYDDFENSVLVSVFQTEDGSEIIGDQELIERIVKDNNYENAIDVWRQNCRDAAMNVWVKAKDYIKDDFIGDNFFTEDNVVPVVTEKDLLKSTTSNALFNTLFVVFSAIYGCVNRKNQDPEGENDEEIITIMRDALQNVQATYEYLSSQGIEYIVDTYSLLFHTIHKDKERGYLYSSRLNGEKIFDSSLVPMLVKSNSMLAFYIQKYPQKQMGSLFTALFNRISEDAWVWDNNKYNVKNTERYLEAVADFYDYYDTYERAYVTKKGNNLKEIEKRVAARVAVKERELRKIIGKDLETARLQEIEKIKASFAFENIFREQVKEIATQQCQQLLLGAIDNITNAHSTKKVAELTPFEQELESKIKALALSYLDEYLWDNTSNATIEELHQRVNEDVAESMQKYAKSVGSDKRPLLALIDIIEGD